MRNFLLRSPLLVGFIIGWAFRSEAAEKREPPATNFPPRGWAFLQFYDRLGLTDQQMRQVRAIHDEYRAKYGRLDADVRKLHQEAARARESVLTDDQRAQLLKIYEELQSRYHSSPRPAPSPEPTPPP